MIAKYDSKDAVERAFKTLMTQDINGVRLKVQYVYENINNIYGDQVQGKSFHTSGLYEINEQEILNDDDSSSAHLSDV